MLVSADDAVDRQFLPTPALGLFYANPQILAAEQHRIAPREPDVASVCY